MAPASPGSPGSGHGTFWQPGQTPAREGSRQGTSAREAPCRRSSTRVPEPRATAGAVTSRGLQGRKKALDTPGPPACPHQTPQLQTQLARALRAASSWPLAARLPFLHAGSPDRAELFAAASPPWYGHGGEKAGGSGRRLAFLEIGPRPPRAAATTGTRGLGTPAPRASAADGGAASPSSDPKRARWLL